ncbi:MAG: ABC transporter permease [Candidatus Thermoplasmatota archaeon]|nr:ABC transporter permease [Candidatus Thermoplasmatota archaeon]MBU4070839.1 ABC transporter permease [Candidatus Thermoplasmatota archaeon]MBU4143522.1 ABC transporter permease [Candidatus Thermoplasmatota archaeon]MBU4591966.1 ABC transporter permease [Candidatus Thermoplasmatota archaeon]
MAIKASTQFWREMKKVFFFIKRDFKILFSYRLAFASMFAGVFFSLFNLVLFGAMFGVTELQSLSFYGGNYISYILIGSIGWGFMWAISGATSNALQSEMMMGTLEAIMSTPTKVTTLVLSYTIYGAFFGMLSVFLIIGAGVGLFGSDILGAISPATVVFFFLMVAMMAGIGMIFGGLTVWTKNIGPLLGLFQNSTMFFSGVYYPISVLPAIIRPISHIMPFYYSVEGLRRSLMPGTPDVWYYMGVTAIVAAVLLILGYIILMYAIKKAKRDGSLSFY